MLVGRFYLLLVLLAFIVACFGMEHYGGKNWEKTVDRRKGLEIGNSTLTVDHIDKG